MIDWLHGTAGVGLACRWAMVCVFAVPVMSGASEQRLSWDQLDPREQTVLEKIEPRWDSLNASQQQRLQNNADQFIDMSVAQRKRFRQRLSTWQSLDVDQRQFMLREFKRFRQLPPAKRSQLLQRYERFKALTPVQRHTLRERWKQATPVQKKQFLKRRRADVVEKRASPKLESDVQRDADRSARALRDKWETLSPDQQQQVQDILERN